MSDGSETAALLARIDGLERRLGELEDVNAIRRLHHAYGYYIDLCRYDEVIDLFAVDGEAIFLSGIYRGHEGVARLYKDWFQQYFTQGRPGPEYGFLLDHFQMQDIITVAPDGLTARGRFRCLLAGGTHSSRDYQPEGLPGQFYEAGVYENEYVRENGVWKIARLDYMVQWQADYQEGWHNTISHLQPQVAIFPENPTGPDELLPEQRQTWPHRSAIPQHYAHPVLAAASRS
jgi:hypothetical protein